jgi:hypothetical protein
VIICRHLKFKLRLGNGVPHAESPQTGQLHILIGRGSRRRSVIAGNVHAWSKAFGSVVWRQARQQRVFESRPYWVRYHVH